ncbi:MAG: GxxExxY protein [Chloroflexi bacterium]|nr:GxxExxY protein [Chloroflexota bacterium]
MNRRDPRTYEIIGAAMEVQKQLGYGFLEAVYHEALALEFTNRGIPFLHEVKLPVFYKAQELSTNYRADFVCFDSIIIEIKAIKKLAQIEKAQLINYLKATNFKLGLLLNFGSSSLEYKRRANSKNQKKSAPSVPKSV